MIKIDSLKISAKKNIDITSFVSEKYKISGKIKDFSILKKSIDARDKADIKYIYSICLKTDEKEESRLVKKYNNIEKYKKNIYSIPSIDDSKKDTKCVIVGMGPAGLFCALTLIKAGVSVVLIERGKSVEERIKDVYDYWDNGNLNVNSNVQFGEGGAGTFSDGKLNTGIKDKEGRKDFVLNTFVEYGANANIIYDSKPHIGTDVLRNVIHNMREDLIKRGTEILFSKEFISFSKEKDNIEVSIKDTQNGKTDILKCDNLILAIGHSARDTFEYLSNVLSMESKPFAMGFRVIHKQEFINKSQYGEDYADIYETLEPSPYKLTYQGKERGVYTFCMCPGGYVVNASSEEGRICVNGMSDQKRDSSFANSAVIVQIKSEDTNPTDCLSGMRFQRQIEENTYKVGEGCIPVSFISDFLKNSSYNAEIDFSDKDFDLFNGIKGKYKEKDISGIFPEYINKSFFEAMVAYDKIIRDYTKVNPLIAASECRSSSPVKILRDENYESSIKGIYPCGEGAGYAGGIVSAAIDGMKVAEAVIKKYI